MTVAGQGTLIGQRLGNYHLEALLGAGGMAEVYRARNAGRDGPRDAAVKVLPESLAADPGYVRRFREEAERVAQLKHHNIVPVLESGEQRGLLYLVMPLLKESLRDRLERDKVLPPSTAVPIARQIAAALAVAHEAGLIHRDVKPENILLDARGRAMLTDFGIARPLAPRRGGTLYTFSGSGLPVGTPEYMPPEQLRADHIDQRADIYALGAVLYEMLTGTVPFPADTPYEVAALVFTAPLARPSLHNPEIAPQLEHVVMKALARNPSDRFQDVGSFGVALQAATAPPGLLQRAGLRRGVISQRLLRQSPGQSPAPGAQAVPMGALGVAAVGLPGAPGAVADVPTLPPSAMVAGLPTQTPGGWPTTAPTLAPKVARRAARSRWLLVVGIVTLLAATVCAGGSLAFANQFGLEFWGVGHLNGATATATPLATDTPVPTVTPEPTETPRPIPMLAANAFTLSHTSSKLPCHWSGTQQVSNPGGGSAIGWHWQATTPAIPTSYNFKWGINASPSNGGFPIEESLTAGRADTLYVSMTTTSCSLTGGSSQPTSFTVTMLDSLNRNYTFTMQLA